MTPEGLADFFAHHYAPLKLDSSHDSTSILKTKEDYDYVCFQCGEKFTRKLETILRIIRQELRKNLCTSCSKRHFHEENCRFILQSLLEKKFPTKRPTWMREDNQARPYELDGYSEPLKLAFEYQGEQHFSPIRSMTQEDVVEIQRRDALKVAICKNKGVKLIVINHEKIGGSIEGQIRTSLKGYNFKLKNQSVNWHEFSAGNKLTTEEKAELHANRMGYQLYKPNPMTTTDEDFYFSCVVEGHNEFSAKKISLSTSRPTCKECGHDKRVITNKTNTEITVEQIKVYAKACLPPMSLLEWAGRDNKNRLYECAGCNYVYSYADRTVKNGKQKNICMNCKPAAKPRVQWVQVLEKAFSLGGSCKHSENVKLKKTTLLEFSCYNEDHPEFFLTTGQFLDSDMWCSQPPCDNRKSKKFIISVEEIIQRIKTSYSGLEFSETPTPGQSSSLKMQCTSCRNPVLAINGKELTFKGLKKRGELKCPTCNKELGHGWAE